MKQATLKIECDLCHKVFEYNDWKPFEGDHTPQPTIKIINKDICRNCLKQLLKLAENYEPNDGRNN